MGQWRGKVKLKAILLDNTELVIGMDFLDCVNAYIVASVNCIMIMDGNNAWFRLAIALVESKSFVNYIACEQLNLEKPITQTFREVDQEV